MEYRVLNLDNNYSNFSFSYNELKEDYYKIKNYSNEEFIKNINNILHFTVFICYLKEIPTSTCLSDTGIIHELIHLLNNIELSNYSLDKIRENWNNLLIL